jgi:hypothetical protein
VATHSTGNTAVYPTPHDLISGRNAAATTISQHTVCDSGDSSAVRVRGSKSCRRTIATNAPAKSASAHVVVSV